jgi:hypothetical protein
MEEEESIDNTATAAIKPSFGNAAKAMGRRRIQSTPSEDELNTDDKK